MLGKTYDSDKKLSNVVTKVLFSKTNLQKFEQRAHSNLYSLDVGSSTSTKLNDLPLDEPQDKTIV